ncbi:peptidyl-prolyl cis-trans isomerase B (cyclophilin B) [Neolewinella xylanilytica]|uniref:peptidylprolyl isomerase n=1 Tax=Neolewinella xylanilytica TaxID=1514080 RepID=A0A2S6I122_9BACT|nr:peptidylprolyl isomerase [Neolewinella xylanilytica]PPK84669.1 peptidyl-prolyl cis-trans isomerase B (cyclophilin B) [Neolewinella xylanilytica]
MRLLYLLLPLLCFSYCARPVASFAAPEKAVEAADTVSFTNTSEKATTYFWEFGNGQTSTEAEPAIRYFQSGDYAVRLTATNEKGKSRTTTQTINVTPPEECLIRIETPQGDMLARLYDATPQHQDNFVKLVQENFYDSLLFHRVIEGFMVQGGDPDSRGAGPNDRLGSGGPGHQVPAEFDPTLAHVKGALAAARTNNPQKLSSGSQFYIVQGKPVTEAELNRQEGQTGVRYPSEVREAYLDRGGVPFLDQNYTVFGMVIEGLDVIDKIAAVATGAGDRPKEDVPMKISLVR